MWEWKDREDGEEMNDDDGTNLKQKRMSFVAESALRVQEMTSYGVQEELAIAWEVCASGFPVRQFVLSLSRCRLAWA